MGMQRDGFHWADYLIFVLVLVVSVGVGIYQSCSGGKQRSHGEYFMGNWQMSPVPVGLSMLMSFMSAIVILGSTAEMYTRGTQWFMKGPGTCVFAVLLAVLLFVPLLYPLKLTSATEYLELRFKSKGPKLLGTFLIIISQVLYLGVTTYSPATALEAVTGIPYWITLLCIGIVATLYTTLGGIKAVIWTDVIQAIVMFIGLTAILIVGTYEVGGISEVWRINKEWDRIEFFIMDPDPRVRNTFWSTFIGGGVGWLGVYAVNQVAVQRYTSMPTLNKARIALLVNIPGLLFLYSITSLTGIVVFAYFAKLGCDPLKAKLVKNPNQLLPYFMMQVLAYPAVPGIFVSTLFAGALSTMSSSLNALAAITWEDLIKWKLGHLPERKKTMITKFIVLIYGVVAVALAFVSSLVTGTVIQIAANFYLSSLAPLLGMFILGSMFPFSNWTGAITGALAGFIITMWSVIGSYVLKLPSLSKSTPHYNCTVDVAARPTKEIEGLENFYAISYLWKPGIGIGITIVVGLIVSLLTSCGRREPVEEKYIMPAIRPLYNSLSPVWRKRCRYSDKGKASVDSEMKHSVYDNKEFIDDSLQGKDTKSDVSIHL